MARRLLLAALAAAALALPAPPASAGDKADEKPGKAADKDDDKPKDKDGAPDASGIAEGLKSILGGFAELDVDKDGKLTQAELPAPELIEALDADKDGALSRDEILRGLKMLAPPGGRKGEPGKDGPAEGEKFSDWAKRRVAMDPRFNAEARRTQFFSNFDLSKDGKIQRKEYAGADGDKVFRDFDRDRDAALDDREVLALVKDQLEDLEKSRRHPNRYNFLVLFDLDDDRRVTREEYAFLRGPASTFQSYDEDGDYVVTYDELYYMKSGKDRRNREKDPGAAYVAPPPEKKDVWDLYDKDHDGRVTSEEFGGGEVVFRRLDRNRDGVLTAADV
jgi:Ca2+-binding EF-hand superfamily protein